MPPDDANHLFKCSRCKGYFYKLKLLRGHERRVHKVYAIKDRKFKCEYCDKKFSTYQSRSSHRIKLHNVKLVTLMNKTDSINGMNLKFDTEQDFKDWLLTEEQQTNAHFVLQRGEKKGKGHRLIGYQCSRSGKYVPRGNGQRQLKAGGSKKIGKNCTAKLKVKIFESHVEINYFKEHNHELVAMNLLPDACLPRNRRNRSSLPPPSVLRRALLNNVDVPIVFKTLAETFPAIPWKSSHLTKKYGGIELDFRMVPKDYKGICWEGEAEFVRATILHFISWQTDDFDALDDANPFKAFDKEEHWAYSSYNYMNLIFPENSKIVKDLTWKRLGFPEVKGRDSSFWLGSKDAYTPGHFDCYGCNLVLQVLGRKKWVLFPPTDTSFMYPTRIPYEESSVFSSVNILEPDLSLHPLFKESHPHVVVLEPGDVLFVPSKWWHFVISLDDVTTSINTWIKLDSDCECRLEESVAKALMSSFISYYEPEGENWLNPKEEETLPEENLKYISSSLIDFKRTKSSSSTNETDAGSQGCKDDVDIFKYKGVSKVDPMPFGDWLGNPIQSECSTVLPPTDITIKKVIDCFSHPEVIAVISRLIQQT